MLEQRPFRQPLFLLLNLLLLFASATMAQAQAVSPSAQANKDIGILELGKPIEKELKGGESHSYHINLAAGQFSYIIVEQKGIDVAAALFDPDGKQLLEVDSPNGTQGPEPVQTTVETTGNYRLEVRSLEKGAVPGRYEIRIEELRQATPQDRDRIAAQRAFAEAMQLQAQGTAESLRKANTNFEIALALYSALGERSKEALTLNYNGLVYTLLGENQKALDYYSRALPIVRTLGDRAAEVTTLNNIGIAYSSLGENQKALDFLNQSLPIVRTTGDPRGTANTLNALGLVYRSLGENQKALEYYIQTLPHRRAAGDRRGEATTLANIGVVYYILGENQKALEYYNQALSLSRAIGDRRGEANTLHNIGLVYRNLEENQKALEYYNQALLLRRAIGDRRGVAHTLNSIGVAYDNQGENQKAIEYYSQALPLIRAVGERSGEAYTLYCFAKANLSLGNKKEARKQIEEALQVTEYLRIQAPTQELRASYFAGVRDYYGFYIDLLMRLHKEDPSAGHNAVALNVSERARARVLLELLAESKADIRQGVAPELLEKEKTLQQRFNAKAERLIQFKAGKPTEDQVKAAEKEIDQLITELEEAKAQIRNKSPRYAALTQPQPPSLSDIQKQLLDPDTLLLEYFFGKEKCYLWLITPSSLSSYELASKEEIESAALKLYKALTALQPLDGESDQEYSRRTAKAESEYPKSIEDLSRLLLAPVASQLTKKRILVAADGALQYLPFSILSKLDLNRSDPLIIEHEVVSLPSISTLSVLRQDFKERKAADKIIAIIADPVFEKEDPRVKESLAKTKKTGDSNSDKQNDKPEQQALLRSAVETGALSTRDNLSRLQFSRREAIAISSLAAEKDRMQALDFEANKETASSKELGRYRYIHFATHGLLNSNHPELSGLALSLVDDRGKSRDGFLKLSDIFNMELNAELVVLSACQTALGKDVKGEGLVGLTRGFMYAGAARVIASLWKVDDSATAELMKLFYQGMIARKLSPSAALREAQIAMMKKRHWHHPFYWSAFQIQGEYR